MNLTVILLNTNFQGSATLKKSIYKFIKNCLFLSFSTSTYANKQINVVDFGYPQGLHCMTHSRVFYKGFRRSY